MAFNYLSTAPGSSDRSWVRMRVMDTSSGSYRLEDEEIEALLDQYGTKWLAAAAAADQIGAYFSARADKRIGKLSISQGSLGEHYFRLGKQLRYEAGLQSIPFAGGISKDQKNSEKQDSDRVKPAFEVDQFDNPGTNVDPSTAVF